MDGAQLGDLPSFKMYFSYGMLDMSAATGCSVDRIMDVGEWGGRQLQS